MELAVGQPDDPHISQRFAFVVSWKRFQFRIVAEIHGVCSGTHRYTFPGKDPLLVNFRFWPLTWLAEIIQVMVQTASAKRRHPKPNKKSRNRRRETQSKPQTQNVALFCPNRKRETQKPKAGMSATLELVVGQPDDPPIKSNSLLAYTLYPTPYTQHPTPNNQHPTTNTLDPTPYAANFQPQTLDPKTFNPKHWTSNLLLQP